MNPEPNTPPSPQAEPPLTLLPLHHIDWRYWANRLLVCNPFFLCSAALLLFGVNRLSLDPSFLPEEGANLLFNFSALQIYSFLVAGTAILLARRKIWYDSALLEVVEHGLMLVPFMLISQGALITRSLGSVLAGCAVILAALRAVSVRRWYPQFNLPPRAMVLGGVLLLVNALLPMIFPRAVAMDTDDWAKPNTYLWFIALPLLVGGANLLPRPKNYGGSNPERHWLPLFLYTLWVTGTGAHFWCLAHISNLPFQLAWIAPAALVAVWTMYARLEDCLLAPALILRRALLVVTFLAPLLAYARPWLFELLVFINALGFAVLVLRNSSMRNAARDLFALCLPLMALGMPQEVGRILFPYFIRENGFTIAIALLLVMCGLRWFRPLTGCTGAIGMAVLVAFGWPGAPGHAYWQVAFLFLLTHSLAWNKPSTCAQWIRGIAGIAWFMNAALWVHDYPWKTDLGVTLSAMLLIAAWFAIWRASGERPNLFLVSCAGAVALCAPGDYLIRYGSAGLIAMAASVFLFAIGFTVAWTRHRWAH